MSENTGEEDAKVEKAEDVGGVKSAGDNEVPGAVANAEETAKEEDQEVKELTQEVKELTAEVQKTTTNWADTDDEDAEEDDTGGETKSGEDDGVQHRGLDEADQTAEVSVQNDPDTPYVSAATFEELGLNENLLKGLYAMKFNKPSKIQAVSLPMILGAEKKNLIGQAHNGSGKTACFVLGMLNQLDMSQEVTQALCVVPTREIARQIRDVIETIGRFTGVRVYEAVKSASGVRERVGNITAPVVVGTPGRVLGSIKARELETRQIKVFVLDEADIMVNTQDFGADSIRIRQKLPRNVQTLLFSATFKDEVRNLAQKLAPNANTIVVKREQLSLTGVDQYFFECSSADNRFEVLSEIFALLAIGQSVIFVRTRRAASFLTDNLRSDGHTVSLLYGGDMPPEERDRVIDEFRRGTTKVLVTTNVLARGVDIPQVTVVINYDLPTDQYDQNADVETYMHRINRTGRFGRKGVAVNFVYDSATMRILKQIESHYKHPIKKVKDVEDLEARVREL